MRLKPRSLIAHTSTAALVVCLVIGATAQVSQALSKVTVVLLGGISSEKIQINYVLYGPFGAYGNFIPPRPDSPTYQIPTSVDGKDAEQIKGFIWAPGCKFVTFDAPLPDSAEVQEFFSCSPLGTVRLAGQIRNIPRTKKAFNVRVDYLAEWACGFFGFADCMIPQIELGTITPDRDGGFEIELPDFSADPISSAAEGGAHIQIVLQEVRGNLTAFLMPEDVSLRTWDRGLKIVSSYPQNLAFSTREFK